MSKDFDFAGARKQAEKEGKIPGGFFKVENGSNRIRLVSKCLPDESVFEKDGKKERRFKWLCLVLDRKDGIVKPYGMPHRVYKDIEALQQNEDYAFDTIPMPYDVDIVVENAGTIQARYKVNPARKNTPLTADELNAIDEKGSIEEVQKSLRGGRDDHFDPDEVEEKDGIPD